MTRPPPDPPLAGLRVVDLASVVAGPGCARHLADFGADVIKVERPGTGDTLRSLGWRDPADDVTLFWKLVNRGKRSVVLDLATEEGRRDLRRLVASADVLVENMRPGKLESLGLAPAALLEANPKLVITRVTGFGQDGPYSVRPGFATLAEAMSGLAAVSGEPDGAPLLPPIALTDEVTGIAAAFATMVALHSGVGQVVDVNLLEAMLQLMGPLPSAWAVLGYEQPRLGAGLPYTAPRGTYRCADGRWVAISATAEPVARRLMGLVGGDDDPRLQSFEGRVEHRDVVDALVAGWVGERTLEEVVAEAEAAEAAVAPVYQQSDIAADPHVRARGVLDEVGGVPMQGLVARLSATPGRVPFPARPLGADTEAVLAELDGLDGGPDRPAASGQEDAGGSPPSSARRRAAPPRPGATSPSGRSRSAAGATPSPGRVPSRLGRRPHRW
jgi:crotonobetainyl-CoA:carnitine CoA-transferase CaiB-like acyl-CoA transferase